MHRKNKMQEWAWKQKNYVWVLVFFEVCVEVSSSHLQTHPWWSHPHGFSDHPHVHGSQVCIIPFRCLAPQVQCVCNWTDNLLKPVLQCLALLSIILKANISIPLLPSFLTSNPFFLPPSQYPLNLSVFTLWGHDISCLDYPLVFSLAPLPLGKPWSQP